MIVTHSVDIRGKIKPYGPLNFTRFQWWHREDEETRRIVFILLNYEINGVEARLGVRMDMDKKAILDNPDECDGTEMHADSHAIWDVVVNALKEAQASQPHPQLVQHDSVKRIANAGPNLESALALISAEVTAEAILRRKEAKK